MRPRGVRRIAVRALGIVALIAASVAPHTAGAQGAAVYIAAGDSIAAGIGSSLPRTRGFPALVATWMQTGSGAAIVLESLAVPGETAATFRSDGQLDRVIGAINSASDAQVPLRAISLSLGGNELLRLQPLGLSDRQDGLDQFRVDYAAALNAIRDAAGPDAPIVVMTYYDLTQGDPEATSTDAWWVRQFNTAIRDAAAAVGATVADIEAGFAERVSEYTHYPFDVHPTNAGHQAIARLVTASLGVAGNGPVIEVVSTLTANRQTPTLRIQALGAYDVASVRVRSDDVAIVGPFDAGRGEYVALLDFGETGPGAAVVTISALDVLHQETTITVTISRVDGQEGS